MKAYPGIIRSVFQLTMLAALCLHGSAQAVRVRPLTQRISALPLLTSGTLTLTATPATVSFALVSKGTAAGSSGVTITTTWDYTGTAPTLKLYGYFSSSTGALTDGKVPAHLIPTSAVLGRMTTGVPTAFTAFTQTAPFGAAGAGLTLLSVAGESPKISHRTDVLDLEINLSSLPSLPAGAYTGTLTLQATMM